MISQYYINNLKERLDARDIIEQELGQPVNKSGKWRHWLCPFHPDTNTPSFAVAKDGYKCFGCGEAGTVIDWRMKYHHESFVEAVTALNGGSVPNVEDKRVAIRSAAIHAEKVQHDLEHQIKEAQAALKKLHQARSWVKYYDALLENEQARKLWNERGVPEWGQNLWQLGYNEDFTLWQKEGEEWKDWWHTATLTIPIWGYDWVVNNVKHRLLKVPAKSGGKYRQEQTGVPAAAFICDPKRTSGSLFIAEGEIKSMVTFITMVSELPFIEMQVIGLPSAMVEPALLASFADYEPIYLCLDPDANQKKTPHEPSPVERARNILGRERVKVISLPMKIDDAIVAGALNKTGLKYILKMGRRYTR